LLSLGRPQEARAQFNASLQRTPRRTMSLLGLARVQARLGNKDLAAADYKDLAETLCMADADASYREEINQALNRQR
jgi:hypothetical protein